MFYNEILKDTEPQAQKCNFFYRVRPLSDTQKGLRQFLSLKSLIL